PQKPNDLKKKVDDSTDFLTIKNAKTNNLKSIKVEIPLGMMVGIAGVSGSGKSSLILDTLVPLLQPFFKRGADKTKKKNNENGEEENGEELLEYSGKVSGWEKLDEVIVVSQKPISRVKTSTPASYVGIWDKIRDKFSKLAESKKRKYTSGHFSYNSDKGRCPSCRGTGEQDLKISFLSSFNIVCKECHGLRYKPEILEINYKTNSIADVLNMTVSEALKLFAVDNSISNILQILEDIGRANSGL
ncbi:unnamed protein product, partial [marine sediment metagenome]